MKIIHQQRKPSDRKQETHRRIVDAAARSIRASGYDGTGVADIMKSAGTAHGGFYAHFRSREAMLAEAADLAGAQGIAALKHVAATAPPEEALRALLGAYLSKEHADGVAVRCPVVALGSEMPRQAPEVRRAATRRIQGVRRPRRTTRSGLGEPGRPRAGAGHRGDDGGGAPFGASRRRSETGGAHEASRPRRPDVTSQRNPVRGLSGASLRSRI